jgi:hypothetical protein
MKRLAQTSSGWVELNLRRNPYPRFLRGRRGFGGYGVLVTPFGTDGWATHDEVGWLSGDPKDGMSLTEFVAQVSAIPLTEAEQIVAESVARWEQDT